MIDKSVIDQVLNQADIVEVISEFVSLKKRGVNHLGICPFHDEKTSSFTVSQSKGIYKCFGCGAAGNVSKFLMDLEKISFPEAIKYLGRKYNIEIAEKELSEEEKKKFSKRESLLAINMFAKKYFNHMLASNKDNFDKAGWEYLKKRKFTDEIIEKFELGYCLNQSNEFTKTTTGKGYKEELLIELGLSGKKDNKPAYDRFKGRVIFPFHSLSGQILGFTGRMLDDDKKYAKYLNSSDSDIFKKGQILYGLYQAKSAIIKNDCAYLVEGNTDVISWHQQGIENTIASSGTALTTDQIKLLHRFTNNIVIVFDNDAAGIKATLKGIDIILEEGMNVQILVLPEGEDPDSFAKKNNIDKIKKYIDKNQKDFILFKVELYADDIKKPAKQAEALHSISDSIAKIPDAISRSVYQRNVIKTLKIDEEVLLKNISDKLPPKSKKGTELFAFEFAKEAIKENNKVVFCENREDVISNHQDGNEHTVGYNKEINTKQLDALRKLTKNVYIDDEFDRNYEDDGTCSLIVKIAKQLVNEHFNIWVNPGENHNYPNDKVSFLQHYITNISHQTFGYDTKKNKQAIEDAAELLSKFDNTTVVKNIPDIAKAFGMQKADFQKIINPFLSKKKNQFQQDADDIVIDDYKYVFDAENLPEYVDKREYNKYNFFAAENKNGKKIFYVFRTQDNTLVKVGNFYMEPLFHLYNIDKTKNKRVVRLNHSEINKVDYVEAPSSSFVDFGAFKRFLWDEGGYVFSKGKQYHHEQIIESISLKLPKCWELEILGQQHEGFFSFSDCIYADNEIIKMDELGLVQWDGTTYYSPSASVIHTKQRKGSDKYENDRYFKYRPGSIDFKTWCELMDSVYRYNDNGKFAILFAVLAAFRSFIFDIDGLFTSPFFIGPTDSGKSQVAISTRSLFLKKETPLFNLNSGTDAAFFTTMEKYRDIPIVFEEYNEVDTSEIKFQGLKAAVHDGQGKQKRTGADSKDIDTSKIYCAPILLGQEAPEKDGGALYNRCIILHVPQKNDWKDEETRLFKELKEKETEGLSNILIEVLHNRPAIYSHFKSILRAERQKLKDDMLETKNICQTRLLNTFTLFTAMAKTIEDHCPGLQLSFSYANFYSVARKKMIAQAEAIHETNKVSVFFDTLQLLLQKGHNGIREGEHFKIETLKYITLQKNRKETYEENLEIPTKILFIRLNIVHTLYRDIQQREALKFNALMMYMKDSPAWIGSVKSTRFTWEEEVKEASDSDFVSNKMKKASINTNAVAFNYDLLDIKLEKEMSHINKKPIIESFGGNGEEEIEEINPQLEITMQEETDDLPK